MFRRETISPGQKNLTYVKVLFPAARRISADLVGFEPTVKTFSPKIHFSLACIEWVDLEGVEPSASSLQMMCSNRVNFRPKFNLDIPAFNAGPKITF